MLSLLLWYSAISVVVNRPFLATLAVNKLSCCCDILMDAIPLFSFNYLWFVYLLSNRWFSWTASNDVDAGLFAFGATLLYIGVGMIGGVGQVYYPRHLLGNAVSRLATELLIVETTVTAGVAIGVVFCRYSLAFVFPKFAAASLASAAILISGIPLCLVAWITPIVIAKSSRPWTQSLALFGIGLTLLYVAMRFAGPYGIVGQSLACLPSALALMTGELILLRNIGLVDKRDIIAIAITNVVSIASCGLLINELF